MQGHDNNAAAATVLRDESVEAPGRIGIQCGPRLVQQPQRRRRRDDPGKADAPSLAGGKKASRDIRQVANAQRIKGAFRPPAQGIPAPVPSRQKRCPEVNILQDAEGRFDGVRVPDIVNAGAMSVLLDGYINPVPFEHAAVRSREARHHPQEARLAAAVRPDENERAAGLDPKIQSRKDHPLSAEARNCVSSEFRL
jgi:hypothetical protein